MHQRHRYWIYLFARVARIVVAVPAETNCDIESPRGLPAYAAVIRW